MKIGALTFFSNRDSIMQASATLLAAGYDARNVHILASREYKEAVEQGQSLIAFLTFMDLDEYLQEASGGCYILAMRPCSYGQITQVRNLLAPHHARLMKYIDTWTATELLP